METRRSGWLAGLFWVLCLLLWTACDSGQPSFEPADPDTYPEKCGGDDDCESGEICIQARCYSPCQDSAECGPGEDCQGGVCTAGSEPDAGMDSGTATECDPECGGDAVCHPAVRSCQSCAPGQAGECSGAIPICDEALGECAGGPPAQCRPCTDDAHCQGIDFDGRCRYRPLGGGIGERVCVSRCSSEGTCSGGLMCDDDGFCVPSGVSCTSFRLAAERRSCLTDNECSPLGASEDNGLLVGACGGVTYPPIPPDAARDFDGGPPMPGNCRIP